MGQNTKTERLIGLMPEFRESDFPAEAFRNGENFVMIAPTWWAHDTQTADYYKSEFDRDYYAAAADFGARPKAHVRRYFQAPDFLVQRAARRPHPLSADNAFLPWFDGGGGAYYLGLDLSNLVNDNAGFCVGHVSETGMIIVDLMMTIPGRRSEHLIFAEVRMFIAALRARGFIITNVSLDSWQSLNLCQDLETDRIKTEVNSTDKTTQLPDIASGLMLNGRVDYYYYPLFIKEATELIRTKQGRIDHPKSGSKDCWDAFVHMVYLANKFGHVGLSWRTLH